MDQGRQSSWLRADRLTSIAWRLAALGLAAAGCAEPAASGPARNNPAPGAQVATGPSAGLPRAADGPGSASGEDPQRDPAASVAPEPAPTQPADAAGATGVSPAAQPNTTRPSRAAVAGRIRDITFDDIKFEMEKGGKFTRSMLTPAIEALDGQSVRLRGFILPSFQQTGIKQFVLVRDNMECCFGPGAALYDCVYVEMAPGKSADFTIYPVAVEGVFHVKEWVGPDGKHLAIYSMEGQQVR
jgi:hypothetical protein